MPNHNRVIWSEGLFIQPQHLQQHERYIENLVVNRANISGLHSYGITQLEIDQRLLEIGKFGINICKGILPDGTAFDIPIDDYAPAPIEVPVGTSNSLVYIALPIKRAGMPEIAINEYNPSCRFLAETQSILDNNAGFNISTEVQVGRLALKLLLEQEDIDGYTYLAIAKINECSAVKQVKLDEQFIPSCLDIHAIPKLINFTNELLSLLHYRGEAVCLTLTEPGYGGIAEVADFMLLQLINRMEILIEFLANKKGIHPEMLYLYLIQLSGELGTFTNKSRRPNKMPPYMHEALQYSFDPIIKDLRQALSIVLEQSVISLPLEMRKYGIWVSQITDRSLLEKADFILAVYADIPAETLQKSFAAQVKIAAVEAIQSLINRVLPGIELQLLTGVPRKLPYNNSFIYFQLNKQNKLWSDLVSSAAIAIHVGNDFPGLQLQLWAVRK